MVCLSVFESCCSGQGLLQVSFLWIYQSISIADLRSFFSSLVVCKRLGASRLIKFFSEILRCVYFHFPRKACLLYIFGSHKIYSMLSNFWHDTKSIWYFCACLLSTIFMFIYQQRHSSISIYLHNDFCIYQHTYACFTIKHLDKSCSFFPFVFTSVIKCFLCDYNKYHPGLLYYYHIWLYDGAIIMVSIYGYVAIVP